MEPDFTNAYKKVESLLDVAGLPEQISKHMFNIKDAETMIIKGHLIIEHTLDRVIEQLVHSQKKYKRDSLRFMDKVNVCDFLGVFQVYLTLREEIVILNNARNDISHSLEFDLACLEPMFRMQSKDIPKLTNPDRDKRIFDHIRLSVILICAKLVMTANYKSKMLDTAFDNFPADKASAIANDLREAFKPYL